MGRIDAEEARRRALEAMEDAFLARGDADRARELAEHSASPGGWGIDESDRQAAEAHKAADLAREAADRARKWADEAERQDPGSEASADAQRAADRAKELADEAQSQADRAEAAVPAGARAGADTGGADAGGASGSSFWPKFVGVIVGFALIGWLITLLDDETDQDQPLPALVPTTAPRSCIDVDTGMSCAVVYGEPHLQTLDGLPYDLQAAGELVAAKSAIDDFEVQARFEPLAELSDVSWLTAAAMNVDGDRVGIYLDAAEPVRVNGKRQPPTLDARKLPNGGVIDATQGEYAVAWRDGTKVRIDTSAHSLEITLPKRRAGEVTGLLGDFDGDPDNDLTTRDGREIPVSSMDFETTYDVFAKSWRIDDRESLFDYAPGDSTATFTDLDFPKVFFRADDLEVEPRRRAEQKCRAAGVDRQPFLDNCILDVGLTDDVMFAQSAAEAQALTSTRGGGTESARPFQLAEDAEQPGIEVDASGVVQALWVAQMGSSDVVVSRALGSEGEWSPPQDLSGLATAPGALRLARNPAGGACVFWDSAAAEGVVSRCYTRAGNWSPIERNVAAETLGGFAPGFDSKGRPIALTMGPSCCVALGDTTLSSPASGETSGGAALALDADGRLHAVFAQQTPALGMIHRISEDDGRTWSDPEAFADSPSLGNQLAADGMGRIHLLESDGTYYRWSSDDGWSKAVQVGGGETFSRGSLAIGPDGSASVAFIGDTGVFLAEQRQDGTFARSRRLSGTRGAGYEAVDIAVDDAGTTHLIVLGEDGTLTYIPQGGSG